MKKWIPGLAFAVVLAACMMAASCEKYALPKLECDTDTICAPVQGGLYNVVLTTNVRWMIDGNSIPKWVYIDVKDGNGNYTDTDYNLSVKVSESEEPEKRTAVINYSTQTLSGKLVIEQEGTGIEPEPDPGTEGD